MMDLPHDSEIADILINDRGGLRGALQSARHYADVGHGEIAAQYKRVAEMIESRIVTHYGRAAAQAMRDGDPATAEVLGLRALRETE